MELKLKYLLLVTFLFSCLCEAQSTPERAVEQLWQAFSRDPQQKPDIVKLNELLHPKAVVYGAQIENEQPKLSVRSATEFIQLLDKKSDTGFYECEVARDIKVYDRFAHVYSVVESRYKENQAHADFVGVNSIQLYQVGTQWQILSIYYYIENPDLPVSLMGGKSGVCLK